MKRPIFPADPQTVRTDRISGIEDYRHDTGIKTMGKTWKIPPTESLPEISFKSFSRSANSLFMGFPAEGSATSKASAPVNSFSLIGVLFSLPQQVPPRTGENKKTTDRPFRDRLKDYYPAERFS